MPEGTAPTPKEEFHSFCDEQNRNEIPAGDSKSTKNRAPTPKEGNRQNVLARFDKISQGARTKLVYPKSVGLLVVFGFYINLFSVFRSGRRGPASYYMVGSRQRAHSRETHIPLENPPAIPFG
ncbi:hypothetical protein [uncultured Rikenella sp.]|uniref:hypothetical protein n=1 Tax=uncultured Rikenella sp. TaxID=368003 RepID=UPI00261F002D|nr:hypothetical protein [uncultured Rikenella sp.]